MHHQRSGDERFRSFSNRESSSRSTDSNYYPSENYNEERWDPSDQDRYRSDYEYRGQNQGQSNRPGINARQGFESQDYDRYDMEGATPYQDRYDDHYEDRDFNERYEQQYIENRRPYDNYSTNDTYRERNANNDRGYSQNYSGSGTSRESDYENYGSGSYRSRTNPNRDERYNSNYGDTHDRGYTTQRHSGGNARNDYGTYDQDGRSVSSNRDSGQWDDRGAREYSGRYQERRSGNWNEPSNSSGRNEPRSNSSQGQYGSESSREHQSQRSSNGRSAERRGAQPGHPFYGNQSTSGRARSTRRGGFGSRYGSRQERDSDYRDSD